MSPVSALPALLALLTALATVYFIVRVVDVPSIQGRFASIDGLRGYLAFFVFLHHSSIWYFYLHSGEWALPPSRLYTHFGQASVVLFFMITGFLFFSKLINGKSNDVDFGKLFVSRFLRLVPLYLFAMLLLFSIVALLSNWTLNEPYSQLLTNVSYWLGFTVLGAPAINGVASTSLIVAGVTWSLPYEWFFYFSLPLLALAVRVRPPLPYLLLSVACVVYWALWKPHGSHLLAFLGGMLAAVLVRKEGFCRFSEKKTASFLILFFLAITVIAFRSAYKIVPVLMLSAAFCLIAGGNSLFRILHSPLSRTFGEMAYSIYLLHGIALFVTFTFVIGHDQAKHFSALTHWSSVVALTPIFILFCYFTFRYIERPAMSSTTTVMAWLRNRFASRSTQSVAP